MRVLAVLGDYLGALCLQELVDQGDEVVAVVTYPDDPKPGAPLEASARRVAERNHLPLLQPPIGELNSPHFVALARALHPDLIVSMNYPMIFKADLLEIPCLGCVNQHPSRLPAGRGMTPAWWHLLTGGEQSWITLHYLDAGIDTGEIIAQGAVPVIPEDDGYTIDRKVSQMGHRLLAENLPLIRDGRAPRIPQSQIGVTPSYYSWKAYRARIPWRKSAQEIALHVRCLTHPKSEPSWTGCAYTRIAGQKVCVWAAEVAQADGLATRSALPGQVLAVMGQGLLVAAGQGQVILRDVSLEGKPETGLADLVGLLGARLPMVFA